MFIGADRMENRAVKDLTKELEISQSFVDLASLVFIVLDADGVIKKINQHGVDFFAAPENEIVGKNWFQEFVPKHSVEVGLSLFQEFMAKGGSKNFFEGNVLTRKGAERVMAWRAAVMRDTSGQSQLLLMSGRDITDDKVKADIVLQNIDKIKEWNKELEQMVQDRTRDLQLINANLQHQIKESKYIQEQYLNSQRLYNAMAHNFPDGIIGVLDREFRYVLVDGKELELFGLTSDDLVGQKIFHWEKSGRNYNAELQKVFEGETASFEVSILYRTYSVTAVPLPDSRNQIREILVVAHNITDRKELEENLYKMISQGKKLNELKTRFVTMALHEFRTPLSTILSSVFLLESYKGETYEEKKGIHIDRIKRTVNILTETLNDFLRLGKLEEGKVEMRFTAINIPEHAEDVLKAVYPLKKAKQKILYQHSGMELNVLLDENLLRSILLNLLSNSIKYSLDDGEVILQTELSEDRLIISVTDRGIGIVATEREHIFQRFFRGMNALNIEGTGLGLYIVKGYVELMNGTINFSSENQMTVFTVDIPLQLTQDGTRLILR